MLHAASICRALTWRNRLLECLRIGLLMTTTQQCLVMRPYEPGDEESVLELLRHVLRDAEGTRRTPEFWRWKHFENPFGPSFLRVACEPSGRVIGLRAFLQWQFQMNGQTVKAVQAVDTATHPAYRRIGVFSTLTKQSINDVKRANVSLIFNTPNVSSRPGYLRMGWRDVGTVAPLILILRPHHVFLNLAGTGLGLHSPGRGRSEPSGGHLFSAWTILHQSEVMAKLLAESRAMEPYVRTISTSRSVEYLQWRYTKHPNLTYSVVFVGSPDDPLATAIVRTGMRLNMREVLLSEIFLTQRDLGTCAALLDELRAAVTADYVLAYAREGSFLRQALRGLGFRVIPPVIMNLILESPLLRFPERQKPRRLVVNQLETSLPVDPFCLQNWGLTIGDLEVF